MLKINLGCGHTKWPDYVNIDADASLNPDLVLDFTKAVLPYENGSIDRIALIHTIEHLRKEDHELVIGEINRVLKIGGTFIVSYPDAGKTLQYFLDNYKGLRDYWEDTILGRGKTYWDVHKSLMLTPEFLPLLRECGFGKHKVMEEVGQSHNTVIEAEKTFSVTQMSDLLTRELQL